MAADFLHSVLTLPLLAGGLLAPGWLLGKACRTPAGLLGAFLGSAALLLNLALLLDAFGMTLNLVNLGAGLALICAALGGLALRASRSATAVQPGSSRGNSAAPFTPAGPFRWQGYHGLFLPVALGLAAIAIRAAVEPLSGFDAIFRWNFLALQMLREGSLHFYPPVTSVDYLHYGWPDGIAPLVSSLYLWSYLCAGNTAGWATAPVVFGQGALLFLAVWQLNARDDRRAALLGCGVLATSSVLLWGVAMGQETGLTALGLVAMLRFIDLHRAQPSARWLLWAGLAAGLGALAREYGLAFIALGLVALAWWRVPRRGWVEFTLAAAVVTLPWYVRNVLKTGNPLYSQTLGGLFPGNPVLADYNRVIAEQFTAGHPGSTWSALAMLAFGLAGIPLVLGLAGGAAVWRARAPWLLALLAVVGLWLVSLGQTSAGPHYAVRVLTPAIALGAALGGRWLANFTVGRAGPWVLGLLTLAALDASVRSLYLPIETAVRWWGRDPQSWREMGLGADRWKSHHYWSDIASAADGQGILCPHPVPHAIFASLGATAVPQFSPAVRFLFAPDADFETCLARLRAGRMRFILLMRLSEQDAVKDARTPFFRELRRRPPTASTNHYFIYDLLAPVAP